MTATSGPLRGLPDLDAVNWLRHYRQHHMEGMPL